MAELINLPFGLWTRVGQRKHKFNLVFARRCQCALMKGHIGATWQIQLNHPSAVVLWPYSNYFDHLLLHKYYIRFETLEDGKLCSSSKLFVL